MSVDTWAEANSKDLVIAWSDKASEERTYIVWERIPKEAAENIGGRLLLVDASWDDVASFVSKFESA
ncbi:hypothetical protein AB0H20_09370 [Nocardia fluminea]|uniref:hypothetical protein n=1 Tax=Nocardia fluminea TaxID=134984 RepID=UPI0033D0C791